MQVDTGSLMLTLSCFRYGCVIRYDLQDHGSCITRPDCAAGVGAVHTTAWEIFSNSGRLYEPGLARRKYQL